MKQTRLPPATRERVLLDHALSQAKAAGFAHLSWKAIGVRAGVSASLVRVRLGPTLADLRRRVVEEAVTCKALRVLNEALALRDPTATRALKRDTVLRAQVREAVV